MARPHVAPAGIRAEGPIRGPEGSGAWTWGPEAAASPGRMPAAAATVAPVETVERVAAAGVSVVELLPVGAGEPVEGLPGADIRAAGSAVAGTQTVGRTPEPAPTVKPTAPVAQVGPTPDAAAATGCGVLAVGHDGFQARIRAHVDQMAAVRGGSPRAGWRRRSFGSAHPARWPTAVDPQVDLVGAVPPNLPGAGAAVPGAGRTPAAPAAAVAAALPFPRWTAGLSEAGMAVVLAPRNRVGAGREPARGWVVARKHCCGTTAHRTDSPVPPAEKEPTPTHDSEAAPTHYCGSRAAGEGPAAGTAPGASWGSVQGSRARRRRHSAAHEVGCLRVADARPAGSSGASSSGCRGIDGRSLLAVEASQSRAQCGRGIL